MIPILIVGLAFCCVAFLAFEGVPILLKKYSETQKKQMEKTTQQYDRMFVVKEGNKILMIFRLTPLVGGAAGFFLMHSVLGILIGGAIGFVIPKIITKQLDTFRRLKFEGQLVDALMLLSSCLKAGMSLTQAFEVLVEEMPPPISDEFGLVLKENHMGVGLDECLLHLKKRIPIDDLGLITSAISVARETGGDLTEIFSQLVFTIREKLKLERKVRALTIQGRLQGLVMSLLPIGFAIFTFYMSPDSFKTMIENPTGRLLLMWAAVSEVIGTILIKKFSKVEV